MDFTQFDFEEFKRLCNENNRGYLNVYDCDDYSKFIKYLDDNNIAYTDGLDPMVWFDLNYCEVCGTEEVDGSAVKIYTLGDFTPAPSLDTFDFEKFTRLCGAVSQNAIGVLDLRNENRRNKFIEYANKNNIACSVYVNSGAPLVWFDNSGISEKPTIRGSNLDYEGEIYQLEDFLQDSAPFNTGDILGFLEV